MEDNTSVSLIPKTLAKELTLALPQVEAALALLGQGFLPPYISRVRREEVGDLSEGQLRRIARRSEELQVIELRRANILRSLRAKEDVDPKLIKAVEGCIDRFELEDLFVAHRRPEIEVQRAVDHGLEALADRLVERMPKPKVEAAEEAPAVAETSAPVDSAEPAAEPVQLELPLAEEPAPAPVIDLPSAAEAPDGIPSLHHGLTVTPELARVCAEFVNTDRDVHSEEVALDGAMRLLSDRLGRSARLRGQIRKMLRKDARLTVRETGGGDPQRRGRYKSLFKLDSPLRQLQPHTLIALRQATKERVLTTMLMHSGKPVLERVRGALGRHTRPEFESVLDAISRRALERRLMPMLEPDIRLELKERGDAGALRLLAKFLRRQLLGLPGGARPTLGVNVNARGAWVIVRVEGTGAALAPEIVIETKGEAGPRPAAELAEELKALLEDGEYRSIAIGAGKTSRSAVLLMREALALTGSDAFVFLINESGVGAWANSAVARVELPDLGVPGREAVSLARRFQDPLLELLKAEPRHLVHGVEQAHVSKAALARVLDETIKSSVAYVGCNVNLAPAHLLAKMPGLSEESLAKLIGRRTATPFKNREELREVLSEVEFQNTASFLQVHGGDTPLDGTGLHPEQYPIVARIVEESGRSFEEIFGQPGGLKGLKRAQFGIDEVVWRDIARELARPGRDPRPRIYIPRLFGSDVEPASLEKGQLVEGMVTNVSNFGAFIDIGLSKDAMVHVSDATTRYVSDAREVFAIGDVVRAKVVAAAGPRITLTLKGVGMDRPRHGAPARKRSEGRGRGERKPSRPERPETSFDPNLRAAQSRRDGLVVGSSAPARGRGGNKGKGRGDRRDKGERFDRSDLKGVKGVNEAVKFNPFANFFKEGDSKQGE